MQNNVDPKLQHRTVSINHDHCILCLIFSIYKGKSGSLHHKKKKSNYVIGLPGFHFLRIIFIILFGIYKQQHTWKVCNVFFLLHDMNKNCAYIYHSYEINKKTLKKKCLSCLSLITSHILELFSTGALS